MFVGVTSGTRIHRLQDYIDAPPWNRPELAAQLTQEVWALSIYHTLVDLFYGIVWLLVVFAFLALAALFYLRRSHRTSLLAKPEPAGAAEESGPVATSR